MDRLMRVSRAAAANLLILAVAESLSKMLVPIGKAQLCEKKQGTYSKKQNRKARMTIAKTVVLSTAFFYNTKGDTLLGVAFWWWEEVDSNYRSQ